MKKLLYLLLLTPIIYLASCSKSNSNEDYAGYNCVDGSCVGVFTNPQYLSLNSCDSLCGVIFGCTDSLAENYDSLATIDDGSCIFIISMQTTQDYLLAEKIFNDIGRVVEDGFIANGENKNCPSYTLINTNTTDQDTMIIDFGNGNPDCLSYGNIKRGKIIVIYTGKYRDPLSVMTATFDNYYVNNNLVQGERIVTNKGITGGNIWFTIEINNASINTSHGTINLEASREREWIEGSTTTGIFDDKYSITGNASGNGVNGNNFMMAITTPLEIDLGCFPSCIIKSGEAILSSSGYSDRIINYGNLICDCNIDVTIDGTTYQIIIN